MATAPPRDRRYGRVAIAFHWTIAALVVANLAIGLLFRSALPAHKAIGITVLAHRPPPLPDHVARWERGAAHTTHWALYLLMILLPLSGWAMVSGGERRPLTWFGLFDIPYLPVGNATAASAHDAHGVLGWLMLTLVVLHVAAALRHHLILRDSVLLRMAPILGRR